MTAIPVASMEGLSRPDWLALRRQGLGSSDAAVILGLDRFRSPYELYLEKTGELPDDDDTGPAAHWGLRLEDAIATEFAELHPELQVVKPRFIYQHPEHAFMLTNPDRLTATQGAVEPDGVLEIKTSRLDDDWKNGPPDRVVLQGEHQLAVTGFDRAHVAVLLHGRKYGEYIIERDDELIGALVEREADFWQRVLDRRPPPMDGTESTTEALKSLYARSRADAVTVLNDDALAHLRELRTLKTRRKQLDEEISYRENEIKSRLGTAEIGLHDGEVVVTWKSVTSVRLKTKALRAAHPAIAAEFEDEQIARRLLVKGDEW